jgi:hypothetical protein
MRQIKRWRYYCDHCRKAGGSKGHMVAHEAGCTANPTRVCGICALAAFDAAPLPELIAFVGSRATWHSHDPEGDRYHGTIDKAALAELRTLADGCPVCMFAAMRQGKVFLAGDLPEFDLKAEMGEVWPIVNEARAERRGYS